MTLGIGTLPSRTRQPVRVISAVYPVQTREQRRLMARNAGHMGRLAALGIALVITAFAVLGFGGSSSQTEASAGGLPVIVPEARSAPSSAACPDVALRSGLCNVSYDIDATRNAYQVSLDSEGRA